MNFERLRKNLKIQSPESIKELVKNLNSDKLNLKKKIKNCLRRKFIEIRKRTVRCKIAITQEDDTMAKSIKLDDVNVHIFDGSNYSNWKSRLLLVLEFKECLGPAEGDKPENTQQAFWDKMDLKARVIITSSVADSQMEYINKFKTAKEMIATFDKMYSAESTPLQMHHRGELEELKFKNFKTEEEFFLKYEQSCNKFIASGGKLDEKKKLDI